jgi:phosphoglycolate phosphatase-like HAD superfamily hydrolase
MSGALNETIAVALLDIDGTLVDSNDFHAHAWTEAFAEAGCPVAFERVRPLLGMGDKLLPAIDAGLSDDKEPGNNCSAARGNLQGTLLRPGQAVSSNQRSTIALETIGC